jgi:hypothetical protein
VAQPATHPVAGDGVPDRAADHEAALRGIRRGGIDQEVGHQAGSPRTAAPAHDVGELAAATQTRSGR